MWIKSGSSKGNSTKEKCKATSTKFWSNKWFNKGTLLSLVATLNPNYSTFMQGMDKLSARQEEILA
ncbi:uncharacterized protein DS421_19g655010 [Arachis hypogaea]|uniref:Uncharacterized protein n=1 Tax=Arachis hypogaea TaxID=3818 RepID=A0A6B9VBR0_ARAHY|nr:uncharacterized protein DS421_19g655010 [Arachis hypogaea]